VLDLKIIIIIINSLGNISTEGKKIIIINRFV